MFVAWLLCALLCVASLVLASECVDPVPANSAEVWTRIPYNFQGGTQDLAKLTCKAGFTFGCNGVPSIPATDGNHGGCTDGLLCYHLSNGQLQWYPNMWITLGSCVTSPCVPNVPFIPHGNIQTTFNDNGINSGDLTCSSGYHVSGGSGSVVCSSGTNWQWVAEGNQPMGACAPNNCTATLPTITHGKVNIITIGQGNAPTSANIVCNSGYFLSGSDSLLCGSGTGYNWVTEGNQPLGTCKPLACTPPDIDNGVLQVTINGNVPMGVVTCNPGFNVVGPAQATCTAASGFLWVATDGSQSIGTCVANKGNAQVNSQDVQGDGQTTQGNNNNNNNNNKQLIIIATVVPCAIVLLVIMSVCMWRRHRAQQVKTMTVQIAATTEPSTVQV